MGMLKIYLDTFGKRGIIIAVLSRLSKYINWPLAISVPTFTNKKDSVLIRLRTSDISVFRDIFVNKEFYLELSKPPRVVIDAGAYTGLSSVYFAARYPDAKIIAIEPEKSNFDILLKNAKLYANIVPVHAALWKEESELSLCDPEKGHWGYRTLDAKPTRGAMRGIQSFTIERIMSDYKVDYIDVLKLDIEGSEKEVLEFSRTWIHKVGVLIVELHDCFKEGCTDSFNAATRDFEYEEKRGEKLIRIRKEFAPESHSSGSVKRRDLTAA